MTAKEAIEEITSEPKYYIGIYPQSTAYYIVKRFHSGSITLNKLREFLNKFGYEERQGEWIKVKVEQPKIKYKFA